MHDGQLYETHILLHDGHDIDAIIRETKEINPTLTNWQVLLDSQPYEEGQHVKARATEA